MILQIINQNFLNKGRHSSGKYFRSITVCDDVIYLNDTTKTIPTHNLTIYADDTTLIDYKSTNEELEIYKFILLNLTTQYFNMILLYVYYNKTECIYFKTYHRTKEIKSRPDLFFR